MNSRRRWSTAIEFGRGVSTVQWPRNNEGEGHGVQWGPQKRKARRRACYECTTFLTHLIDIVPVLQLFIVTVAAALNRTQTLDP